jgi:hypothetical protein
MHTGSIVDFYDDPQGLVLKNRLPQEGVPDFIKQAEFLDEHTRGTLPDDVFALVMVDRGEKLRKFACVDKGNVALNVIYFMENRDRLPEEAQKTAAANLARACSWFDLAVPMGLDKEAGFSSLLKAPSKLVGGGMAAADIGGRVSAGKERHRQMTRTADMIGSNVMPTSGSKEKAAAPSTRSALRELDKQRAADPDLQRKLKRTRADMRANPSKYTLKSAALQPYVDVTGQRPPERIKQASAERHCLIKEGQAHFPIDSYGQIKQASVWFDEYGHTLHPAERREYCTKLASRADEVGIEVSDLIRKYGSPGYATDGEVNVAVCTRMQHWADDAPERDMLKGLMEKAASVSPDVFCEALRQFDEATGMDHLWDDEIYDPWFSTYGFKKEAAWSWQSGNDRVTEAQLKLSAKKDFLAIREAFGLEVAEEYRKNPQQVFDSMPLDSKRILTRMANDPL